MRKRTYTALVNTGSSLCDDDDNTSSQRNKHSSTMQNATYGTGDAIDVLANKDNENPLNTGGLVTHGMSSGINNTGTTSTTDVDDPNSDIPLTTIHNLVGTCEIASSTVPIDLEYVYRCLPNR